MDSDPDRSRTPTRTLSQNADGTRDAWDPQRRERTHCPTKAPLSDPSALPMTDAGTPGSSSDSAPSAVVTFVTALPDGSFGIGGSSCA